MSQISLDAELYGYVPESSFTRSVVKFVLNSVTKSSDRIESSLVATLPFQSFRKRKLTLTHQVLNLRYLIPFNYARK